MKNDASKPNGDKTGDRTPEGNDLMTTDEVLEALGISKPSLYKLIHAGVLEPIPHTPLISRARRNLFKREDVERVLADVRAAIEGKPAKAND